MPSSVSQNPLQPTLYQMESGTGASQEQATGGATGTPAPPSAPLTSLAHTHTSGDQTMQQQLMQRLPGRRDSVVLQMEYNGTIQQAVNLFRQWSQDHPQGDAPFPAYLREFIEKSTPGFMLASAHEQAIIADKLALETVAALKQANKNPIDNGHNRFSPAMHYPTVPVITNRGTNQQQTHPQGYMNPDHWEGIGNCCFRLKQGASPSAAIKAAFEGPTRLDCLATTQLVMAKALLETLGDSLFNYCFGWTSNDDPGIVVGKWDGLTNRIDDYRESFNVSYTQLKEGDWIYYANDDRYRSKHPAGAHRGENLIYIGNNQFEGFWVNPMSFNQLKEFLEAEFNRPPSQEDRLQPDFKQEVANATDPRVRGWHDNTVYRVDVALVQQLIDSSS